MLREMKVFTIDAMSSNSMKSSNPHSGIHETEVAKCLDTMCLDPSCNQGGHMVVIALEGNGARPSHMGKGFSEDGRMYTLNTIEQHSICFRKSSKPKGKDGLGERWVADDVTNTLNCFEFSNDTRTPEIVVHETCYEISRSMLKGGYNAGGMPMGKDIQPTITSNGCGAVCYAIENHPNDSRVTIDPKGIVQILSSRMGTGGNNTPFVLINSSGEGISAPLDASYYKGQGLRQGIEREYLMIESYCCGNGQLDQTRLQNKVGCLDCMHDQKMVLINGTHYYTKQRHDEFVDGNVASSLKNRDYKEFTDIVQEDKSMEKEQRKYVLRRLTPTECARLQGFPDWWCDGANGSDSAQYKLWGNGIALPCACDILGRIAEELRNNP